MSRKQEDKDMLGESTTTTTKCVNIHNYEVFSILFKLDYQRLKCGKLELISSKWRDSINLKY